MKAHRKIFILIFILALLVPAVALAAIGEGPSDARKIWDKVMLFVNFGIFVFIAVKFGRKPLMDFLRGHGSKIDQNLEKMKTLLDEAQAEFEESRKRLDSATERVAELERRTRTDAEKLKDEILSQAQHNSIHILDDSRNRAETEMKRAWEKVKLELIEMAIAEAERLIREKIQREDDSRMIDDYLTKISDQESA